MLLLRLILRYPKVYAALVLAALAVAGVGKLVENRTESPEPTSSDSQFIVASGGRVEVDCSAERITFFAAANEQQQLLRTVEAAVTSSGLDQRSSIGVAGDDIGVVLDEPLDPSGISELVAPVALNAQGLDRVIVRCADGRLIML